MATFLDTTLLDSFSSIFVVLLIFAIIFGLLEYIKPFGDGKRSIHSIISLFIALLFLISRLASAMIRTMVPWFVIIIIFIFFVLMMVRMFGLGESEVKNIIKDSAVYPWIIIFSVIVLLASLSAVFGQYLLAKGTGDVATVPTVTYVNSTTGQQVIVPGMATTSPSFADNLLNTLRNTKVLGMAFIFLVGAFIMIFLTKPAMSA